MRSLSDIKRAKEDAELAITKILEELASTYDVVVKPKIQTTTYVGQTKCNYKVTLKVEL